jgi:uncharacterized membrane protein YvbJ
MALIACPECSQQISNMASACPHCGVGVASARETLAAGTPITTIQETSKRLKLHTIGAVTLLIVGVVLLVGTFQAMESDGEPSPWPGLMMFIGFVWYIVTRIRIWWHHK